MSKYSDSLLKSLDKQIAEEENRNKQIRKGIYTIPSPSNILKVSDKTSAKKANTPTVKSNGNLSDKGYSSTVNDFKNNNVRTTDSLRTLMGQDLADYNAMTIGDSFKGGNYSSARKLKPSAIKKADELKAKYGITDEELDKVNKAYTQNRISESEKKGLRKAEQNAIKNPIVGEINRALLNPLSAVEGIANLASAKLGKNPNNQEDFLAKLKEANTAGTSKKIEELNVGDTAKGALNLAANLGRTATDMGVNYGIQAATGIPMGLISAGNTADESLRDSLARGSDIKKASDVALTNAAVDYVLNQKGLDEILKLSKEGKTLGKTIAKSAGIEGLEEGVQNLLAQGSDTLLNYNNSQFKALVEDGKANGLSNSDAVLNALKTMGIEDLQSAGAGALFGGLFPAVRGAKAKLSENMNVSHYLPHNKITGQNVNTDGSEITSPEDLQNYLNKLRGILPDESVDKLVQKANEIPNSNLKIPELATGNSNKITDNNVNTVTNVQEGITQPVVNNIANSQEITKTGVETQPQLKPRTLVSPEMHTAFEDAGINNFELEETTDYDKFSSALSAAKAANAHGFMVDSKSPEDIVSHGGRTFTDKNNTVGVIVEANGNISGVFKNPELNNRLGAVNDLLLTARENGGTKLDCYGKELVNKYERDGFTPVAVVRWNEDYRPDDWVGDGKDVYIMVKDARTTEQVLSDIKNKTTKYSTQEDLSKLPVFDDYDEGLAYRDRILNGENASPEEYSSYIKKTVFDSNAVSDEIYKLTQGEVGTPEEIKEMLDSGENIKEITDFLEEMTDPENMMPKQSQERAQAMLDALNSRTMAETVNDGSHTITSTPEEVAANVESAPVPPQEITKPDVNYPRTEKGNSRVITNTGVNSGAYSVDEVLNDKNVREIMEYDKANNSQSMERAVQNFTDNGDVYKKNFSDGTWKIENDVDVDTAQLLLTDLKSQMDSAVKAGDTKAATALKAERDLLGLKLRRAGTAGGQFIQAFAKWNFTPEGAIMNAERIMDARSRKTISKKTQKQIDSVSGKLLNALNSIVDDGTIVNESEVTLDMLRQKVRNTIDAEMGSVGKDFSDADIDYLANVLHKGASTEDLADILKTKLETGKFTISDETIAKVNDLFNQAESFGRDSKQRVDLETDAFRLLANEACQNATIWEKFEAWRYLAMLGNPKTHIRNIIGNSMFSTVTGISNNLAAAMEEIYSRTEGGKEMRRTKAFLNIADEADRNLISAAKQDAYDNSYRQLSGTKYADTKTGIERNAEIFKNPLVRALSRINDKALSGEDTFAMVKKYSSSLAGYLKANGLDANALKAEGEIVSVKNTINDVKTKIDKADSTINNLKAKDRLIPLTDVQKAQLNSLEAQKSDLKNQLSDLQEQLDSLGKTAKMVREGREYAIKQAEYSAFHEENDMAESLQEFSTKLRKSDKALTRVGGYLIEGLVPFKKTPLNIIKSGIDYSPASIVKAIKTAKTKGDVTEVIEDLSKGLTGSGIMLLGWYLGEKGILNINNDDQKYTNPTEGKQQYSMNIGGYNFTIDFAVPSVMPLLVGAEISKIKAQDATFDTEKFIKAITSGEFGQALSQGVSLVSPYVTAAADIASPIAETSMLSSINDNIEALRDNGEGSKGTQLIFNTGLGYFSQGIPTVMGQVARTIDPLRRSTYSEQTGVTGTIDKRLLKMGNKIPFLSKLNQPYIDANGRTQNNAPVDNALGRAAYQFLSPAYIQKINPTNVENTSDALYNQSKLEGSNKFLMNSETSHEVDGSRLSKGDYTTWTKEYGTVRNALRENLFNSDYFKGLSEEEKLAAVKEIDTAAKDIADYNLSQGANKLDETQIGKISEKKNVKNFVESNGDTKEFLENYIGTNQDKADATETGVVKSNGDANVERYEKLSAVADGDKDIITALNGLYNDAGKLDTSKALKYFSENNIPEEDAGKYMYELNGGTKGGKMMNAAYNAFDYAGVKEYYNIKSYCNGDITKTKATEYLAKKGITKDKNRGDYVKWLKIFGFTPEAQTKR